MELTAAIILRQVTCNPVATICTRHCDDSLRPCRRDDDRTGHLSSSLDAYIGCVGERPHHASGTLAERLRGHRKRRSVDRHALERQRRRRSARDVHHDNVGFSDSNKVQRQVALRADDLCINREQMPSRASLALQCDLVAFKLNSALGTNRVALSNFLQPRKIVVRPGRNPVAERLLSANSRPDFAAVNDLHVLLVRKGAADHHVAGCGKSATLAPLASGDRCDLKLGPRDRRVAPNHDNVTPNRGKQAGATSCGAKVVQPRTKVRVSTNCEAPFKLGARGASELATHVYRNTVIHGLGLVVPLGANNAHATGGHTYCGRCFRRRRLRRGLR